MIFIGADYKSQGSIIKVMKDLCVDKKDRSWETRIKRNQ